MIMMLMIVLVLTACIYVNAFTSIVVSPTTRTGMCLQSKENNAENDVSTSSSSQAKSYNVEAARELLLWEKLSAKEQQPILNLASLRNDNDAPSLLQSDGDGETMEEFFFAASQSNNSKKPESTMNEQEQRVDNSNDWNQGQKWLETEKALHILFSTTNATSAANNETKTTEAIQIDGLLESCPQLLRLDTTVVMKSAEWLGNTFSNKRALSFILAKPTLLAYTPDHLQQGWIFLTEMMMMGSGGGNDAACKALCTPDLLLSSVEGSLQHNVAQSALGKANEATQQANQQIYGNMMKSLRFVKNIPLG